MRSLEDDPALINTSLADTSWHVESAAGAIIFSQVFFLSTGDQAQWHKHPVSWKLPGVTWNEDGYDTMWNIIGPQGGRTLCIAYWVPASVLAVLIFAMVYLRPRFMIDGTVCATCGYDLRATPERCPECGAIPAVSRPEDSLAKSTADEPAHGV